MCCFTQPVKSVGATRIFARMGAGVEQHIAYAMSLEARGSLAMVLPVPVVKGSGEDAMKFINLEKYPTLFDDLEAGFPPESTRGSKAAMPVAPPQGYLKVHSVGSFDASFVPTIADFHRLDKRFRFPDEIWKRLPGYADYGFAVFKLKKPNGPVHPMAFSFPSAEPQTLFFPTLHIHDGQIHQDADFDHTLYCQGRGIQADQWRESPGIAMQFVQCDLTEGLVSPKHHVYRRQMYGLLANGDVLLRARKLAA